MVKLLSPAMRHSFNSAARERAAVEDVIICNAVCLSNELVSWLKLGRGRISAAEAEAFIY